MAVANAKVTVGGTSGALGILEDGHDNSQKIHEVYGSCAIDASPATYAAGGIPIVNAANVALNGWANEKIKVSPLKTGDTGPTPIIAYFESTTGSGYWYVWNSSTNKLQIFTTGSAAGNAAQELATGAIPAAVSGDTILVEAKFVRK